MSFFYPELTFGKPKRDLRPANDAPMLGFVLVSEEPYENCPDCFRFFFLVCSMMKEKPIHFRATRVRCALAPHSEYSAKCGKVQK